LSDLNRSCAVLAGTLVSVVECLVISAICYQYDMKNDQPPSIAVGVSGSR